MIEGQIRVIVLGIVRNKEGRFLFDSMKDSKKNLTFLRPIGGGVENGESCKNALAREFKEEINAKIIDCKLLNAFENIFEYEGKKGHEIIFLFDVTIEDSFYKKESIEIKEGKETRLAKWFSKESLKEQIIYPPEIKDICKDFFK